MKVSDWRLWVRGVRLDDVLVPVLLPEPLRGEVLAVHDRDGLALAVRHARQRTGLDLRSATLAVRALCEPQA